MWSRDLGQPAMIHGVIDVRRYFQLVWIRAVGGQCVTIERSVHGMCYASVSRGDA